MLDQNIYTYKNKNYLMKKIIMYIHSACNFDKPIKNCATCSTKCNFSGEECSTQWNFSYTSRVIKDIPKGTKIYMWMRRFLKVCISTNLNHHARDGKLFSAMTVTPPMKFGRHLTKFNLKQSKHNSNHKWWSETTCCSTTKLV